MTLHTGWISFWKNLESVPGERLLATMTLLLTLLYTGSALVLIIPVSLLCLWGLLFTQTTRHWIFWLILTLLPAAAFATHWHFVDNHKVLLVYWLGVMTLGHTVSEPGERRRFFETNARYLIGLCMLLAWFWKIISPDFLNTAFFQFSLLTDGRFQSLAAGMSSLTTEMLTFNRDYSTVLTQAHLSRDPSGHFDLHSAPQIASMAAFITYWTVVVEGLVALFFFCPERPKILFARNLMLLVFVISTYALVPVVGFGWLLIIMGIAQCKQSHGGWRAVYVAAFFLIFAFQFPFAQILGFFI